MSCVSGCSGKKAENEFYCSSFVSKPISGRICRQDCPGDCALTAFGPWSACDSCFVRERSRHREVIKSPISSSTCALQVSEYQPCVRPEDCYQYWHSNFQYRLSTWSICVPFKDKWPGGSELPEQVLGARTRDAECINATARRVDERSGLSVALMKIMSLARFPRRFPITVLLISLLFKRASHKFQNEDALLHPSKGEVFPPPSSAVLGKTSPTPSHHNLVFLLVFSS